MLFFFFFKITSHWTEHSYNIRNRILNLVYANANNEHNTANSQHTTLNDIVLPSFVLYTKC